MINPISYILKVYILIILVSGMIMLIKLNRHYVLGLLLGSFLVLSDMLLLSISFRRYTLNYLRTIVYMFLRVLLLGLVILLLFIYGIINKLNVIGVFVALLLYPLALIIGGIKVLKWKK